MTGSYIRGYQKNIEHIIDLVQFMYWLCQVCCCVLIVYYCWYVQAFGNWGMVVNSAFLIMCGCLFLIWIFEGGIQYNSAPFGVWNSLIMTLYCLVTGFFVAYDQSELFASVREYLIYFLITYALCFVSKKRNSFLWILRTIQAATLICCFHMFFFGHHYTSNRVVLTANSNPNLLGVILCLGLFSIIFKSKMKMKNLVIVVPQVLFVLYSIIMTGSRKSLIVALILLGTWGISLCRHTMKHGTLRQKWFIWIAIIGAVGLMAYYYKTFLVNTAVFDRMQTMGNEESNSARLRMYADAFEIFKDKPFFGGGLDQFRFWSGWGVISHSTYAEALADFGLIGTVLYLIPHLYAAYRMLRLSFQAGDKFHSQMVLGLCAAELFLGTVQIWFIEMSHFFIWTIIFLYIQGYPTDVPKKEKTGERKCIYFR